MTKFTEEEILETIFLREIRAELDRELISSVTTGSPVTSTPMKFESKEQEDAYIAYFDMVIKRDIDD